MPSLSKQAEWRPGEVRDYHEDSVTVDSGQAQKESIMGGIIILSIIDPFPAWKPPLCYKDTAKGKKCP